MNIFSQVMERQDNQLISSYSENYILVPFSAME